MTSKEKQLYKTVFQYLRDGFGFAPKEIMLDYESSSRNAAKEIFKTSKVCGCHFHFNQSLERKASQLDGLRGQTNDFDVRTILDMFKNLPLLPFDRIEEGFNAIKEHQMDLQLSETFATFNQYFEDFWIDHITPQGFGVSDLKFRTNNFNEGYNSKLKGKMKRRQNVYEFLKNIIDLMEESLNNFEYDKNNQVVFKSSSKITPQLEEALPKLNTGQFTVKDFLLFIKGYK